MLTTVGTRAGKSGSRLPSPHTATPPDGSQGAVHMYFSRPPLLGGVIALFMASRKPAFEWTYCHRTTRTQGP
jgi:hypothetical protein